MSVNDPSTLYAIIMGGLIILFLLVTNTRMVLKLLRRWLAVPARQTVFLTLKYAVYPLVLKKSRAWFLLQIIYWSGNIATTFIRTHDLADIRIRSGYMSIINLAPLFMSDRLRFPADLLGIPIQTFVQIHGTLGVMSFFQGALHVSIAIHQVGWHPSRNLQLYGLLAIIGIFLSLATMILQMFARKLMSKFHGISAFLVGITVLCHLQQSQDFSKLCFLVSCLSIPLLFMIRLILLVLRNCKYPKIACHAEIIRMNKANTLRIVIPVNRPFRVEAGMIVYIWMPGVGFRSALQTYFSPICWWDNDTNGNATSITLFARKSNGFTQRLMDHQKDNFLTWIDGPYGSPKKLESYSRVLLIATGIGIMPVLSYIRLAVESNQQNRTRRDIFIVWEIEDESNLDWIYDWMDELLKKDNGSYKLCFALHVPSRLDCKKVDEAWNSNHGRIFKVFSPIHVKEAVPVNFWAAEGKALIAVSAHKSIVNGVFATVPHQMKDIVHLLELPLPPTNDFQKSCARISHPTNIEDMEMYIPEFKAENDRSGGFSANGMPMASEQLDRRSP